MAIYFSSRRVPELKDLDTQTRIDRVRMALDKLSVPQKLLFNIIKLLIITPLFYAVASVEGWSLIYVLIPVLAAYFVVVQPLKFYFCRPILREMASAKEK